MASHGTLLGSGRLLLPSQGTLLCRPRAAGALRTRSSGSLIRLRSRIGVCTKAISAPDKPTTAEKAPFTAWDTAVQRVPKRTDLKTIMILGAGPIIIGQVSIHRQGRWAPAPCPAHRSQGTNLPLGHLAVAPTEALAMTENPGISR